MTETFLSFWPELKDKIDYVSVGTPLTNDNYFSRYNSYGLEHSTKRFEDKNIFMNIQTTVKNLYLTG